MSPERFGLVGRRAFGGEEDRAVLGRGFGQPGQGARTGDPDVAAGDDGGDAGELGLVGDERAMRPHVEAERYERCEAGEDPRRRHPQEGRQRQTAS